jgi:hypothetical protein
LNPLDALLHGSALYSLVSTAEGVSTSLFWMSTDKTGASTPFVSCDEGAAVARGMQ